MAKSTCSILIGDTRLPARFWSKVHPTPSRSGCWEWTASKDKGYGRFYVPHIGYSVGAYRVSYEALVGPIPEGLEIDHLCRNPGCVNPEHLEPVTHSENMRRMNAAVTHCPRGHEYSPGNTRTSKEGYRSCRACHAQWQRERRARRKESRT